MPLCVIELNELFVSAFEPKAQFLEGSISSSSAITVSGTEPMPSCEAWLRSVCWK